jgi:hypothetical protein
MRKFMALAVGAAIATTATHTLAQTPPGTDRPKGDTGTQSANPDMDKKKGNVNKGSGASTMDGTPIPPGTDRPAGEEGTTSAKPNPGKK